jgi:diacylglycerol kinase family enzyme
MMHYLLEGKDSNVRYLRSAKVELHCELQEQTDIDGQPGPRFPLHIECLKGELRVRI